jgi:light-regulated signal transduction histidine kinase (bacteriophytochrome)
MESLFRCPICQGPLDREDNRYLCPKGHSFDRSAAGYVHLLPPNKMHSKDPGDDKGMATARNRFLSADHYRPLCDALSELAVKYAPEGDAIAVSLRSHGRKAALAVENGLSAPMDPDTLKHLFDRFYRPDSSRTSKAGGHGIGLSIAKRIVTLHNGTIEAVPGDGGLTFRIKLSNRMKASKENKHGD